MKKITSSSTTTHSLVGGRMLKPAEVAEKLALSYHRTSRAGFWASVRRNGIPYVVLNSRTIRFSEVALERWLAGRSVGGKG